MAHRACVPGYPSAFARWETRAAVRAKPERRVPAQPAGQLYFPPELVPPCTHPLVTSRPPEVAEVILIHRLYHYLRFTIDLEQTAVLPVAVALTRGLADLDLPAEMIADAYKITTDEAWHAQCSHDLMRQVSVATGVAPCLPGRLRFNVRLTELASGLNPAERLYHEILFSIVSETLITATLTDIPRDSRMPDGVRDLVGDHAEDEGRHHAYFKALLARFWPVLSDQEKGALGPRIPTLIQVFLEPDYGAISQSLRAVGLTAAEADQVVADSYPQAAVNRSVNNSARSCVRYFAEAGALDDPRTADSFAAAGLTEVTG